MSHVTNSSLHQQLPSSDHRGSNGFRHQQVHRSDEDDDMEGHGSHPNDDVDLYITDYSMDEILQRSSSDGPRDNIDDAIDETLESDYPRDSTDDVIDEYLRLYGSDNSEDRGIDDQSHDAAFEEYLRRCYSDYSLELGSDNQNSGGSQYSSTNNQNSDDTQSGNSGDQQANLPVINIPIGDPNSCNPHENRTDDQNSDYIQSGGTGDQDVNPRIIKISLLEIISQDSTPIVQDSMGGIYRSEAFFLKNYEAMERDFAVYVYPDGDPRTCNHLTRKFKSKYASEHFFFMNLIESRFWTKDLDKAHLYFIPVSCQKMGEKGASPVNMEKVIEYYVQRLISKYPYWNRTFGADHFFVSCHDIGSRATRNVQFLLKNAIQLVCSPTYDSYKYIPHKDVAFPQILELSLPPGGDELLNRSIVKPRPLLISPEKIQPPKTRLGFWAGVLNSEVRRLLRIFWKDDPEFDFHVVDKRKRGAVLYAYEKELYRSKFCICPRGETQVGGVCLAESMTFGCVPGWKAFQVEFPSRQV